MIKAIKTHRALEFNQSRWLKPYIEFNTKKKKRSGKKNDNDGKALYILINNAHVKTIETLRNRINLKPVDDKKRVFKIHIKTKLHVAQNIWQYFNFNT